MLIISTALNGPLSSVIHGWSGPSPPTASLFLVSRTSRPPRLFSLQLPLATTGSRPRWTTHLPTPHTYQNNCKVRLVSLHKSRNHPSHAGNNTVDPFASARLGASSPWPGVTTTPPPILFASSPPAHPLSDDGRAFGPSRSVGASGVVPAACARLPSRTLPHPLVPTRTRSQGRLSRPDLHLLHRC